MGLIGILFFSCEKSVKYQLSSEDSVPVLYMFPMPDSTLKVYASYSTDILSSDSYTALQDDAHMTIEFAKGEVNDETYLSGQEVQVYDDAEFGEGDTISVSFEINETTLTAKTTIPKSVKINDIDTIRTEAYNDDGELEDMMRCRISLTDPLDTSNYYQLRVDLESEDADGNIEVETLDYDKEDAAFSSNDYESIYITDIDYQGTFDDYLFDGKTWLLKILISQSILEEEHGIASKKLHFYLYSLSVDYYDYIRSLIEVETYREDPLYQQDNLYSNVNNGLGVVAGLSVDDDTIVIY